MTTHDQAAENPRAFRSKFACQAAILVARDVGSERLTKHIFASRRSAGGYRRCVFGLKVLKVPNDGWRWEACAATTGVKGGAARLAAMCHVQH